MKIDYTKLNNRIVEQAQEASRVYFSLTENQKEELFQNKLRRAEAMIKSRDIVKPYSPYITIED